MDLLIPISTFLYGDLSKTENPLSTMPDKVNLLWVHLIILRTHLNISHRKWRPLPAVSERGNSTESLLGANQQTRLPPWITRWHGSQGPPTRRRRSPALSVAAYSSVPFISEQGWVNKRRGSLAFFSIHACFENITCLADYMIIILKGCQGASGIIIIWFAGFRAHGNTLVLGGFL